MKIIVLLIYVEMVELASIDWIILTVNVQKGIRDQYVR